MDRKRRLMENNNGWPLRNQLFDGAPIALPLTHTVIGRGGLTPSFTRATTETGQKYDEAGYLDFTALAGEIVFKGARREYNQWTTSSVSLASGANKSLTLAAGTYQFSMGAGTGTATFSGTGGATGTLAASTGRVSVAKTISAGTFVVTASVADLADLQVCNITGETDQTTIRPYVNVGVESAPAYHGSMVDGVKCFPTDRSGNPISTSGSYPLVGYVPWEARTNLCLQSNAFTTTWTENGTLAATQNAIGPDGGTTAWTLTDNDAGIPEHLISGSITLTAAAYTYSLFAEKTAGATTFPVMWFIDVAGTTVSLATLDTNAGAATVWASNGYGLSQMASASARCTSHNDLFWRFELTATGTAAAYTVKFGPALSNTANKSSGTFDAAQGSAVFYGAQVELGSFATPYIPTTTVAVARNADVLTYTGAQISSLSAFTLYMEAASAASADVVGISSSSAATRLPLYGGLSGTKLRMYDGTNDVQSANWARPSTTKAKLVASFDGTATGKGCVNGGAVGSGTFAALTWDVLGIGCNPLNGAGQMNGPATNVRVWARGLSNSELQAITS